MQRSQRIAGLILAVGLAVLAGHRAVAMRPEYLPAAQTGAFHGPDRGQKVPDAVVAARKAAAVQRPDLKILWNEARGVPSLVVGEDILQEGQTPKGLGAAGVADVRKKAVAVMGVLAPLCGIRDANAEFDVHRVDKSASGYSHVRLKQKFEGLPVFGGDLIVHFDGKGKARSVNGAYRAIPKLNTKAALSAAQAAAAAKADLAALGKPAGTVSEGPDLVVYAREEPAVLAYQLVLSYDDGNGAVGRWRYWIDAQTGAVVTRFNDVPSSGPTGSGANATITGALLAGEGGGVTNVVGWHDANLKYYLYNYANAWSIFNTKTTGYVDNNDYAQRSTNDWGSSDPVEMSAGDCLYSAQTYYLDVHGRNSFNAAGAMMKANVHYGNNYVNAYWNGTDITIGDGDGYYANSLAVRDVIGHEFTHAVTEYTAALVYDYVDSGALNESFSDIFGTLIEFHSEPDGRAAYPGRIAGHSDWLMGEDCWLETTALRDMRNPANAATVGANGRQPTRYKGTYWDPYMEMHQNDSVQNFFFYLFCEGGAGTNDGVIVYNVSGIGIHSGEKVAYLALTSYITPTEDYPGARDAWVAAAAETDSAGTTTNAAIAAMTAWAAVGLGSADMVIPNEPYAAAGENLTPPYLPSNKVYTVLNPTGTNLAWQILRDATATWLSVDPTNFVLAAGSQTSVVMAVNQAVAATMAEGTYMTTVTFTNSSGQGTATRLAVLRVGRNYRMISTPYQWIDPLANLHYGARVGAAYPISFPFMFYGVAYSNLYLTDHGILGFVPSGLEKTDNKDFPDEDTPNAAAYPLWEEEFGPASLYYKEEGTAPNRRVVLTWLNVAVDANMSAHYSYQVILKESAIPGLNNDVVFQYKDVAESSSKFGFGRNATIGLEDAYGAMFRKYSYKGEALLVNERAILFTQWPPADTNAPVGTIRALGASGSTVTFDIMFSEPVTGLDAGDLSLAGSTVPGVGVAAITGGGLRYLVDVTNVTTYGRVVMSVASNAVHDLVGLVNDAFGPAIYVVPLRTVNFADDMEGSPAQWTPSVQDSTLKSTAAWEWGVPSYFAGPPAAHSGTHCWGTVLTGDYPNAMNAWVESIPFNVGSNPILNFYVWYDLEAYLGQYFYDFGYVEVNNGTGWYPVTPDPGYYGGFSGDWIPQTIALDDATFGNRTLQIRFRATSDFYVTRAGMYVDDVQVASDLSPGLWVLNYTPTNSPPGASVPMHLTLYNSSTVTYPGVVGTLGSPESGVSFSGATAIAYGNMFGGDTRTNPAPITLMLGAAGNFANPAISLLHQATAGLATFGETLPFWLDGVTSVIGTNVLIVRSSSGVTNWLGQYLKGDGTAGSCLFQVISAGSNGVPDPATSSGQVTGDDRLLYTLGTRLPWGYFGEGGVPSDFGMFKKSFAHSLPSNTAVYVRAWDASTFDASVAYGDSSVYRLKARATQTNDFGTWGVGTLSNPSRDSNGDSIPDGVAIAHGLDPRQPVAPLTNSWWSLQQLGNAGGGSGQFATGVASPTRVACSDKFLFALDTGHNKIQVWNRATGGYVGSYGTNGVGNGQFSMPYGLGMDPRAGSNRFAVADQNNFRVQVFQFDPATGTNITFLFAFGDTSRFSKVTDVALAPNGRFYVTSQMDLTATNRVLQVFSPSGVFQSVLALQGTNDVQLSNPMGVDVGSDGTVVVADTGNNRLMAWDSAGNRLWTAGTNVLQFNAPKDVAFGPGGLLFVADTGNSRLDVLRLGGSTPSLVATIPTVSIQPSVSLAQPFSLVVPAGTNIAYVADTAHYRVLTVRLIFDSDGDGMDDMWEILHGLDPTNPNDALQDYNGNGILNIGEYRLQQDPGTPLLITAFSLNPQFLRWQTVSSGGVYRIEYALGATGLVANGWQAGPTVTSKVQGVLSATNLLTTTNWLEFIRVRFVTNSL